MSPNTDNIQLQHWIRVRDADAFNHLAKRYSGVVFGTCLRILRNRPEAEDATQECFETLARIAEVPRAPLGAWLHRVATNQALDRVRADQRRRNREQRYAADQPSAAEPTWDDVYPLVDEAIAELPDKLRIPVVAHFLEGQSYTAVAESTGTSRQVITNRVQKGVSVLRKALLKRGVQVSVPSLAAMMSAQLSGAEAVPAVTAAAIGKLALAGTVQQATAGGAAATLTTIGTTAIGGIAMSKPIIAGIGAAAAIVCTGIVYTVTKDEPNDAASFQGAANANTIEAYTSAETSAVEAERARLVRDLSQAEARIRELETTVNAQNQTPVPPAPADMPHDEAPKKIPTLEEFRIKAGQNREAAQMAKAMTDLKFGNFLTDARLAPEDEAEVRALISESQLSEIALQEYGMKVTTEMTWEEYAALQNQERALLSEQVRPLLTPDQAGAWDTYLQRFDTDLMNKSLRSEIGMLSNALTPENLELAINFGSEAFLGELDALEKSSGQVTAPDFVHYRRRAIQTMREQLPAYLSPEQMTELENYLTFADNMLDKQLMDLEQAEQKKLERYAQANGE